MDDLEAAELEGSVRKQLVEGAQLYAAPYFFATIALLVAYFLPGWFRFVTGFLVAVCIVTAWSTFGRLALLSEARRFYGRAD